MFSRLTFQRGRGRVEYYNWFSHIDWSAAQIKAHTKYEHEQSEESLYLQQVSFQVLKLFAFAVYIQAPLDCN